MKNIRVVLALAIWMAIGSAIWYAGYLLFDHTIRSYQYNHNGVEMTGFPWNKAYTGEERWRLLKSFAYVKYSACYDSSYSSLSQIVTFQGWEPEDMFFNLYDVFFLRPQSDTAGKYLFFSQIKQTNGFQHRTNSEIESYFKICLPKVVIIKQAVLEQLLSSIWKERNQSSISLFGNILNILFLISFFALLMLAMFGRRKLLSLLKFDELRN